MPRVRYRLTHHLPPKLVFRNGIVLLEVVRDVVTLPMREDCPRPRVMFGWVFRARRPGGTAAANGREHEADWLAQTPEQRAAVTAVLERPLPTINPAALIAATRRVNESQVVILSSLYGRQDLERKMRRGFVVAQDSPEGRMMEMLVRAGYAAGEVA